LSQKKKRAELESPDAFLRTGGEIRDWIARKQKVFFGVVVAALGILLVGAVVRTVDSNKDAEAAKALASALEVLQRPVSAKPEPGATGDEQPFATQKDKDEAVVKSLEAFRAKYAGTQAAGTAALTEGQAQLRLGQPDAALASFDAFLKDRPGNDPLRALALEGKGYAYEAKGQLDQALSSYATLSDAKSSLLGGMGLYHQARIFILQGKKQDAAKVLSQISIDYPDSAAASLAKDRLDALAAQGIKPPAAMPAMPASEPAKAEASQGKGS
jgi:tetratricopeptide (TPR) repeat protein